MSIVDKLVKRKVLLLDRMYECERLIQELDLEIQKTERLLRELEDDGA